MEMVTTGKNMPTICFVVIFVGLFVFFYIFLFIHSTRRNRILINLVLVFHSLRKSHDIFLVDVMEHFV